MINVSLLEAFSLRTMRSCVCVCTCVSMCDKSGSILWSAAEASVIGQAMSLLVLKGFAQERGHRRVIPPFVG